MPPHPPPPAPSRAGTTRSLGAGSCDAGPGQYEGLDQARTQLRGLGTFVPWGAQSPHRALGGLAPVRKGVAPPSPPPSSGTRRHLHTFRLARCSPFRPPRFQLLIWKRKKKPAGRGRPQGGNWSRGAAPAPPARGAGCRRSAAPPRDDLEPRPQRCPAPSLGRPLLVSPSPRPRGGAGSADPKVRNCGASAAQEGAPAAEGGRGTSGGRSPSGALLPRASPSPEEARPESASSVSLSEPKPFCNPSALVPPPDSRLRSGIPGPIRETKKPSPREGQLTSQGHTDKAEFLSLAEVRV